MVVLDYIHEKERLKIDFKACRGVLCGWIVSPQNGEPPLSIPIFLHRQNFGIVI